MGVKDIAIFWSVEVRGDFVLSVNGIVWQRQLANEAMPHQKLCSLWGSSSRLTTNRNLRWYLGFPKQEAAKSSKRAIHFPLIMMLLLNLLWGYWSVFRRVAREVFYPHFSPDERPTQPAVEPREGYFSVQNWLLPCDSGSVPFCILPPTLTTIPKSQHGAALLQTPFSFQGLFCGGEFMEVSTHLLYWCTINDFYKSPDWPTWGTGWCNYKVQKCTLDNRFLQTSGPGLALE